MRWTRNRTLATIAVATLTLGACGGDDRTASEAPDETTATEPEPAPEPDDEDEPDDGAASPEFELLDEGTDPQPLRLAFEEGTSVAGTFLFEFTQTSLTIDGEDAPAPPTLPVESDIVAEITGVDADGASVEFRYEDVRISEGSELSDDEVAAAEQEIAALEGVTGSFTVDDRGIVSAATVDADPATGLDQLGEELAGLTVPFPEEAVGEGGRWRVTQSAEINGIVTEQVITITLQQRDGDQLTLDVAIEGSSPPGPVDLPDAPGAEVEIVSLTLTGSGSSVVDLTSPLPVAGESTVDADQTLEITEGDQTSTLEQAFTITATFTAG